MTDTPIFLDDNLVAVFAGEIETHNQNRATLINTHMMSNEERRKLVQAVFNHNYKPRDAGKSRVTHPNTILTMLNPGFTVQLYDTVILSCTPTRLYINLGKYPTNTTIRRINQFLLPTIRAGKSAKYGHGIRIRFNIKGFYEFRSVNESSIEIIVEEAVLSLPSDELI